jgi:hypothetical protein
LDNTSMTIMVCLASLNVRAFSSILSQDDYQYILSTIYKRVALEYLASTVILGACSFLLSPAVWLGFREFEWSVPILAI